MSEDTNTNCPSSYGELPPCSQIMDVLPVGLIMVDGEGCISTWNPAMERLTGYSAEEALGQSCTMLSCDTLPRFGAGRSHCDLLREVRSHGGDFAVEDAECEVRTRDGERVPVLINIRVLTDENGVRTGSLETLTDLRPLRRLEENLAELKRSAAALSGLGRMVGESDAMGDVYERIHLAADSTSTVLLLGETGTGKELAAEAIHQASSRSEKPFVKVNCSALSDNLLESELFGHVKGAFTGAIADKMGRFEAADGGTLLLDEIGDISPLIQLKLLRVLQEQEFERVGESVSRKVDVRVICATHRDLRALVREGTFREDLFYRIRVFPIQLPALRERKSDLPLLVNAFIERFNAHTGKQIVGLTSEALHCLMDYCWPGNVRELENAIEHAFVTCQQDRIGFFDLPQELRMVELRSSYCSDARPGAAPTPQPTSRRRRASRDELLAVLEDCGWNQTEAARRLGVDRTTIWRKMKRWGISPDGE